MKLKVTVLIGSSGTGKSYQAIYLAKDRNIRYMIDDGLLIKGNKVLAGFSAKREKTKMAAVRRALFMDRDHRSRVKAALYREKPEGILVLGTSEKMVNLIVNTLELGEISERVFIGDISTEEEIIIAKKTRKNEGKHVIPVPTFEIKKDFSGYFLNPLKVFKKIGKGGLQQIEEKSVVRPTFSYLGKYKISNRVIRDLIFYAANKVIGIYKIEKIGIQNMQVGLIIDIEVKVVYGNPIIPLMECLQEQVKYEIEEMTSLNILAVDVSVSNLVII